MKIAVLGGTGNIGEGFAVRWSRKHEIFVCSRGIDRAVKAADEYTGKLLEKGLMCYSIKGCTNEDGIKDADVVILSVPYQGVTELLKSIIPCFKNQIVISLVVPMKKDKLFKYTPPKQGSAALEIKDILPKGVKVVSAYHNISAKKLAIPDMVLDYDVVVCSDDEDAKKVVMELTKEIKDLRPLDGGDLGYSSMVESMTPFLINIAIRNKLSDLGVKFM